MRLPGGGQLRHGLVWDSSSAYSDNAVSYVRARFICRQMLSMAWAGWSRQWLSGGLFISSGRRTTPSRSRARRQAVRSRGPRSDPLRRKSSPGSSCRSRTLSGCTGSSSTKPRTRDGVRRATGRTVTAALVPSLSLSCRGWGWPVRNGGRSRMDWVAKPVSSPGTAQVAATAADRTPPGQIANIAAEALDVLAAVGSDAPLIVVGHSQGGLYAGAPVTMRRT